MSAAAASAPGTPPPRRRRRVTLLFALTFVLIILFGLAPLLVAMGAGAVAEANGCRLDEGSMHPCIVGGEDIGRTLYTLFVLGWFAIATLPIAGVALLIWFLALVAVMIWRRRSARA